MIRVLILAPTPTLQAGLQTLLTTAALQIVGATSEPELDAIAAADVIILANDEQLEHLARVVATQPARALIVLSNYAERTASHLQTMDLRGWSIVPLDAPAAQLQAAVQAVAQGLIALPGESARHLYKTHVAEDTPRLEERDESLTPREQEVLELVGQGLSNKLIARRLHISEHTVKFHLSSVSSKLGAASRTDAVRLGVRSGLIAL